MIWFDFFHFFPGLKPVTFSDGMYEGEVSTHKNYQQSIYIYNIFKHSELYYVDVVLCYVYVYVIK